jgi:hypothetical protein
MLATGAGGGEVISKNFSDIPKNFPDILYFPRKLKKFSGNNINSSFQKCKKSNLNDIIQARKGHFPEKGHFGKLGGPGPLAPPVPTLDVYQSLRGLN